MTLSENVQDLLEEYEYAREQADHILGDFTDAVSKYHGPWWRSGGETTSMETGEYAPSNTAFEYISLLIERLASDNPRVRVQSRRTGGVFELSSEAMQHGLNRWIRDSELLQLLQMVATDFTLKWGVTVTSQEQKDRAIVNGQQQTEVQPRWPVCERLSPKDYFQDPGAIREQDLRFRGHEWRMDRETLIKAAKSDNKLGWNLKTLESWPSASRDKESDLERQTPFRDEIHGISMWVPEIRVDKNLGPSDGYNGTVFTFGLGPKGSGKGGRNQHLDFLREPQPFYGPIDGPYTMFGAYYVPDSAWPLSPLTATTGQQEDLNAHLLATSVSMQRHKRFVGVPDARTAKAVKDSHHDFVVVIPHEDGKALATEFEYGGHTEKQLEHIGNLRYNLDRVLGVDDAVRGAVTGEGTATEHAIASESANARMAFLKHRFMDSTQNLLMKVAHYLHYSETVEFSLGQDAVERFGPDAKFSGGLSEEEKDAGLTLEDHELEIEPYSMERSNEGLNQKRALELHSLSMEILDKMVAYAGVPFPWKEYVDHLGDSMNMPDLGRFFAQDGMEESMMALRDQMMADQKGGKFGSQSSIPKPANGVPLPGQVTGANAGAGV